MRLAGSLHGQSLENEIQKRGTGHEEEAVKAWMKQNPGIA